MRKSIKIVLILMILLGVLIGCSKSQEGNSIQLYREYNQETQMFELTEKAFEDAELLSKDKIDPNQYGEVYLAMFGISEYRKIINKYQNDRTVMIVCFLDRENKAYEISDTMGKITMREIPRLAIDEEFFYDEIRQIREEKFPMWEEYIRYLLVGRFGFRDTQYTILGFNTKMNDVGEKLHLKIREGYELILDMNDYYHFSVNDLPEDTYHEEQEENTNLKDGIPPIHSKNYTRADLNKLPKFPELSNDGFNSISFYYPQLDKKYVLMLDNDSKEMFKEYLEKSGLNQSYDFNYFEIEEKEDGVLATIFFKFYPIGNWQIAELQHEYYWQDGRWILNNEEFILFDYAGNLRLEIENKGNIKLDLLSLVENKVWIYPIDNYEGVIIEFIENEMHQGYYRSERDNTDKYKVERVKDDVIEMTINDEEKMIIKVMDRGEKLEMDFRNNTFQLITEEEWLRIKSY